MKDKNSKSSPKFIEAMKTNKSLQQTVIVLAIIAAALVIFFIIGITNSNDKESDEPNTPIEETTEAETTEPEITEPETEVTTEEVTTDPPETDPPETAPPVKTYSSGKYKVGVDIPAGEYFLQAASAYGGYMSINSDSNGDDILENENFNTHHYITIQDGQYLELNRVTALSVNDMTKTFDASNLDEGMYRVGIDIPAGEYRLTAANGNGYVCVYDNSSAYRDIQSNNNFETNDYVTVANGQYLLIHRCTGSIVQ